MRTRNLAATALLTGLLALTGATVAHATDLAPTGSSSVNNRSCNTEEDSLLHGVVARLTAHADAAERCDANQYPSSQVFGELTS
ncbi:hypothetical protein ACFYNL_35560 [Streptomyces sp. NPDC007808]|uniref:hypothetical protein n=1 Tax=Streptomyces sp. NPDC007808 TaxID=3364779 RepID=UPI0036CE4B71